MNSLTKDISKINNIEKFDALFFGIYFKQAYTTYPMNSIMLEHTYETIIDAGINSKDIPETKIGVLVSICFSDTEATLN
ncbi:hypothetical protein HZH68_004067 [Vespula germanica]|uniref:Beta-ketoacyl synthase-like N-terminal domain-containing protein n=1 Tax=Vespula germanica TaxID=30212 RepID=A0A834KMV6_VESGE|nr:hypothetical protein HZH68_004067 [Vespula germanica]